MDVKMINQNDLLKQELAILRKDMEGQLVKLYQDIAVNLKNLVTNIAADITELDDRLTLIEDRLARVEALQSAAAPRESDSGVEL
jgi:small-conductance mechanosensitive channel